MDTLDAELQRIFADVDVEGADIEAALAGVHALNRRRTTWRMTARVAGAAVLVGILVAVGAQQIPRNAAPPVAVPDGVDLTGAIPWSDRQDYERWSPPLTEEPRPDATPCRADDLGFLAATQEGAGGHVGTWARFRNIGHARCTLSGYPGLTGREGELIPEHGTFFPESVVPATVDPGETAVVVVETSSACDPQTPVYQLHDAALLLQDGSALPLDREFASACPIRIGRWYREPYYPTEPPSRFGDLRATIEAPASAKPGTVLTYVVVLENIASLAVDLQPCPGFRQALFPVDLTSLSAGKPLVSGAWRLSCDGVGRIAPGGIVRFEMRIDVPEQYASSPEVLIEWVLVDDMPDYAAQLWVPVEPDSQN